VNTRAELLLWAQRVIARKTGPAHEILELKADSTPAQAQEAFHKIARTAHPDLHRKGLNPNELEMLTSAYAITAGAYQTMRTQTTPNTRLKPTPIAASDAVERSNQTPPAGTPTAPTRPTPLPTRPPQVPTRPTPVPPGVTPPPSPVPVTPAGPSPSGNAAQAMSSKALIYYRKAELCLKRGDLKGAVLQIKLAIAADPVSAFLRTALAEVELEFRKGT
jgi:hypothetical protein